MNNEMTAGLIGRLVITIITKMGNMLGENVDLLLKAVISKMQLVSCLKAMMSLVVIFAYLILTQLEPVLNFLSTVPGPTGEPAMQFVLKNWLSKQSFFFGAYERKVTTMALCKLFEYGVTTQDERLTSITIQEIVVSDTNATRVKTRSQAASSHQWINTPALVKIFKLLINELEHYIESQLCEYETESEEEDDPPSNDTKPDKPSGSSPSKTRFISDLYFDDDEEDSGDDDQLTQELLKDPLFQTNIEDTLKKFIHHFSSNAHFGTFVNHLNESEKNVLKILDILPQQSV